MAKVKQFAQTLLKERDRFWSALFKKYEEESKEGDSTLQLYIDNSSSRIETLIQSAEEDNNSDSDSAERVPCLKLTSGVVIQPDPNTSSNSNPQTTHVNDDSVSTKELNKGCEEQKLSETLPPTAKATTSDSRIVHGQEAYHFSVKRKLKKPIFVMEIIAEDDHHDHLQKKPEKKFRLYDPHVTLAENSLDSIGNDISHCSSDSLLSSSVNDAPSSPKKGDSSIRFLCRRVKSRNRQAPKRFRLA